MRIALSAVMLSLALGASASVTAQCNQSCPHHRTISVSGSGVVTVDADLAIVHVGYKLYAADAKSAYASASETSNAIMAALTALGIPKRDIESSTQQLQHTPPYDLQQMGQDRAQHEFTVDQSWTVQVPPDKAAQALDAAVQAGANDSGSIDWTLKDPGAARAHAAAKAVADARHVAHVIAQTAGVRVTGVVSIAEDEGGGPRPIVHAFAAANGIALAKRQPAEPLAINSRRVEVTDTVSAVFAID